MRLSSRQIEIFVAAVAARSTRRAAAILNISQPAVSRAIAELEAAVGAALFDRSGRGFEPTFAAKSLMIAVDRHFSGLDRVREAALRIREGTSGHLRVFALPVLADTVVASAAGALMTRHPKLRLDIESVGEHECLNAIRSGRADVAFVSTVLDAPELKSSTLRPLRPVVALHAADKLAQRSRIRLADLAASGRLLGLPSDSPFRRAIDAACVRAKVVPEWRAVARTQTALVEMVRRGGGMTIVHRAVAVRAGAVVVVRPLDASISWPVTAIYQASDAQSATLSMLLKAVDVER